MSCSSVDDVYDIFAAAERAGQEVRDKMLDVAESLKELKEARYIDKSKSVTWNEEHVAEEIKKKEEELDQFRKEYNSRYVGAEKELEIYLAKSYNIPEEVAKKCVAEGYTAGHSGGYGEVIYYAGHYAEFAEDVINIVRRT